MLSLDDPRWQALCARGSAADVVALLRALQNTTSSHQVAALTAGLAEYLCPQDEVHAAGYAALPHLVELAAAQAPADRVPALSLVGRIAALAQRAEAPAVPPDLRPELTASLDRAAGLVLDCLRLPVSAADLVLLCATLAAARGQAVLALDLMETFRDPRQVQCPVCEAFYPSFGYELIHGTGEA
jgi:hypothetical protein